MTTPRLQSLSVQQARIILALARGLQRHEIAAALGVAPKTVHSHLHFAYLRLRARNSTQAVVRALQCGELYLHDPALECVTDRSSE